MIASLSSRVTSIRLPPSVAVPTPSAVTCRLVRPIRRVCQLSMANLLRERRDLPRAIRARQAAPEGAAHATAAIARRLHARRNLEGGAQSLLWHGLLLPAQLAARGSL